MNDSKIRIAVSEIKLALTKELLTVAETNPSEETIEALRGLFKTIDSIDADSIIKKAYEA